MKKSSKNKMAGLVVLLFGAVLALTVVTALIMISRSDKEPTVASKPASIEIVEEEIVVSKEEPEEIEEEESVEEVPEPEWECYLSQDFLDEDGDWNLIDTVESTDGVTDFIPVNPKYFYAAYCPGEMTISSFDKDRQEITVLTKDVSAGVYFEFSQEARYVKVSFTGNNNYFVSSGIPVDSSQEAASDSAFYVISPNAPVDMSISRAVSYLKHWGTVLILPGTYEDNICDYHKVINLYGVGRDLCKIVSYDGDYDNPPLEIAAGTIRNLSLMALGTDTNHARKAYAVHADYDYQNTKTLTFSNCYMYSDYNSGLGMGTRTGNVTVNGCEIAGHNPENGDFFLHDTIDPNFAGDCNITIKNSTFGSLVINAMETEGNNVNITIKGNQAGSISGVNAVTGGYYEGFFRGLKNFTLSADSDVQ